jgi:hypothetical protein
MAKHRGQSAAFMRSINPHLHKRKVYKSHSVRSDMVKRRRSRARSGTRSRSRSRGSSNWLKLAAIGGLGFIAYKIFLAPKLSVYLGSALLLAELAAGYFLMKKRGIVGDFGKVLLILSVVGAMYTYVVPVISSTGLVSATATTGGSTYY